MNKNIKTFIKTTLMGGLAVLLPLVLLLNILLWLGQWVNQAIQPAVAIMNTNFHFPILLSQTIVVISVIIIFFSVGILVRNRLGVILVQSIEKFILNRLPGYAALKEIVGYFLTTDKKSAFSQPALIRPWGDDTWLTGFIVDTTTEGYYSVFVPTSPNPTSGFLMHVPTDRIKPLDTPGSQVFKTIISCGAGSSQLLKLADIKRESKSQ